jgi:hypothetical protein
MVASPPAPDRPSPFEALAAVARTLGESIDLRQVFTRVAEAARTAVPFERMRVLLEEGEGLRVYASEQNGAPGWEDGHLVPRADISHQFWHDFVVERVDVRRELDPAFAWDRETIESGHRSIVRAMLRSGERRLGVLGFASRQPDAFTAEHEVVVLALADLVSAALEHERMWNEEHRRRRRGDALDSLLPTLAKSMDIREIFQQISEVSQDVIPHDFVGIAFLSPDGTIMPVYALSEGRMDHLPAPTTVPERMARSSGAFFIVRDAVIVDHGHAPRAAVLPHGGSRRGADARDRAGPGAVLSRRREATPLDGLRGAPLAGEISGVMMFGSKRPHAYDAHDADSLAGWPITSPWRSPTSAWPSSSDSLPRRARTPPRSRPACSR